MFSHLIITGMAKQSSQSSKNTLNNLETTRINAVRKAREKIGKSDSYIANCMTLEKAPCNLSAPLNSEEQHKLHAS